MGSKFDVIGFYSYKGGAGRSVTTFNTLPFLLKQLGASQDSPVLVIDMDLDSAGLTYLFEQENTFREKERADILEFINGDVLNTKLITKSHREHKALQHTVDVSSHLNCDDESVYFLGVNDLNVGSDSTNCSEKFEKIIKLCRKYKFRAVVIDSASGNQNIAQEVLKRSSVVVTCMKATSQFRNGTFNYLNRFSRNKSFVNGAKIILLPVAIPKASVKMNNDITFRDYAVENLNIKANKLERELDDVHIVRRFLDKEHFGIPEIESFKWQESLLNSKMRPLEDENLAISRYKSLATTIVLGEDHE